MNLGDENLRAREHYRRAWELRERAKRWPWRLFAFFLHNGASFEHAAALAELRAESIRVHRAVSR